MIHSFKLLTVWSIVGLMLIGGFLLFTKRIVDRTTAPYIKTNLSQLAKSDIGFIYFDAETDSASREKLDLLLAIGAIQELYIAYDETGEALAKKTAAQLSHHGIKVIYLPGEMSLLTAVYNICKQQHDCSMMMIGSPNAVKHALLLTIEIGQPAIGYLTGDAAESVDNVSDLFSHFTTYFHSRLLSQQLIEGESLPL